MFFRFVERDAVHKALMALLRTRTYICNRAWTETMAFESRTRKSKPRNGQ
ncbi:hypothetical protein RchiOBHm_Chr5g0068011 [Rosa chinensis]|uniref:Uncharacterized protein n=1 Tax=Rosa chinensis TaxID=74649 RepID=A0A2P6QJL2_ROSCH|nr:hypothetical protein RchiOBHm_Chr5g0068011 [Rosa chinensis]